MTTDLLASLRSPFWPKTRQACRLLKIEIVARLLSALTWRDARGDGGSGQLALSLGGHGRHLDGVGGERREARHLVLLSQVGQVVGHSRVGPVELLPRDAIASENKRTARLGRNSLSSKK